MNYFKWFLNIIIFIKSIKDIIKEKKWIFSHIIRWFNQWILRFSSTLIMFWKILNESLNNPLKNIPLNGLTYASEKLVQK